MAKRPPKEGPMAKEPYEATRLCHHGVDADELTCSKCIEEAKPGAIAAPPENPEPPAEPPPTPATAPPSDGGVTDPTATLKQVVLGTAAPSSLVADQVVGARVVFCPRPNKWRLGAVLRLAGVDPEGNVLVDLEFASSVGGLHATCDVPYGEGVRNWKFLP
jgi:hypothetical protein